MKELLKKLNDLRESHGGLTEMGIYYNEKENRVRLNLEFTYYDYDFIPLALEEILDNYMYEWNYSYEIEIYL